MKEITLSQGKVALVDDKDYNYVNSFKWYAKESKKSWYAVRNEKVNRRASRGMTKEARRTDKRKKIRMHNFIMRPAEGFVVHHKNGNGLDNQCHNLEICTHLKNQQLAANKTNEHDYIPF